MTFKARSTFFLFSCLLTSLATISAVSAQSTADGRSPGQGAQGAGGTLPEYRLQSGDDITIKVFNRPELEDTVRIRPDGRISLLLVDEIEAAGLTVAELDRLLTERYTEFYQNPEVTVVVRTFANQKVYVAGEVGQPGVMPLVGKLTVLGAVAQAGGFRTTARRDDVVLIRKGEDDKPVVQKLNMKDVIYQGVQDTELQPFDVVYVPMSRIAKVDLFVDQYMRQLIPVYLTAGFNYIIGDYQNVLVPAPPR